MIKNYSIDGMTCGACVAKVKKALEDIPAVNTAMVQLETPQARLDLKETVSPSELQQAIGKYKISPLKETGEIKSEALAEKSLRTYKPLLLIIAFIFGVSLLAQYPFDTFSFMLWMRYFMAGFFLVFSFFKLLNISGFANNYAMYDILAGRWKVWGYIYPFVELALGIAYLINFMPWLTNWLTLVVLGISSIGVIKSNLNRQKIKCACLGDVFNLPMSTVTIVEDVTMVLMAGLMLFYGF